MAFGLKANLPNTAYFYRRLRTKSA